MYTVDVATGQRDPHPATPSANPVQYIQTVNNPDWFVSSHLNDFGATVVSTQSAMDASVADPSATTLGAVPSLSEGDNTMQRLVFSLSVPLLDVV